MGPQPTSRGRLARAFEAREAARREAEFARSDVLAYYAEQQRLDAGTAAMSKDPVKRRDREALERRREEEALEQLRVQETAQKLATQATEE